MLGRRRSAGPESSFPPGKFIAVIGDSAWDLLAAGRKNALGVGLLAGGYGEEDLQRAGAFRVYTDPADLLMHIEQLGLPSIECF